MVYETVEVEADPLTIYRSIAGVDGMGARAGYIGPRAADASETESHSYLILIHT